MMARVAALVALLGVVPGCEIAEEVVVPAEDVVVVEGLLQLRDDVDGQRIMVFLHRTVSGERPVDVPDARVTVTLPDGGELDVPAAPIAACVAAAPEVVPAGTCHFIDAEEGLGIRPGDRVELTVRTAAGEEIRAATTVPGAHRIANLPPALDWCWIPPDEGLEIVWTSSEGAWAYFTEALLRRLDEALAPEGIVVETNPFYLTGISISSADTTIVLPQELGVFDRTSLDTEVAIRLQRGIPDGVLTDVAVTAVDRNYVNWVRGGNFNPSGQVRIPSARGEGTGYFGSSVVKAFQVFSLDLLSSATRCREPAG